MADTGTTSPPKRSAAGIGAVLALMLALYSVVVASLELSRPWFPLGRTGLSIDNNNYVSFVEPGSPAARAGIAVGDRFDISDFSDRIRVGWGIDPYVTHSPDQSEKFLMTHNGKLRVVTITTVPEHRTVIANILAFLQNITGVLIVLTALALVLFRPTVMTWGFYLYAFGLGSQTGAKFGTLLSTTGTVVNTAISLLTIIASAIGLVLFALLFPTNNLTRKGVWLQRVLAFGMTLMGGAYIYYVIIYPLYGATGGRAFSVLTNAIIAFSYILSMLAFADRYAHAREGERPRMKWVVAGFAIGGAGMVATYILGDQSLSALNLPVWLTRITSLIAVVIPLMVAYAVIRNRVIDVRFAISRALVLGSLTAIFILLFSLIDWLFVKKLSASGVGTVTEIVVAIALGFWLNGMHGKVDRLVDALFFRRRHLAEERLHRISLGLPHAATREAVDDALVREPVEALDLTSGVAFVRAPSGVFESRSSRGWGDGAPEFLSQDEPILLHLQGAAAPLRLDESVAWHAKFPNGSRRPIIAIPIMARRELIAAALYGPHASGADLDADELRAIIELAAGAAYAYGHIEAEMLRKQLNKLTVPLAGDGPPQEADTPKGAVETAQPF